MEKNYHLLINKIDAFIRKYYINMLIKGLLISLGIIISFFLILDILEHFFRLSMVFRRFLFYSFIIANTVVVVFWIIIPLSKLISFGKRINHEQAAKIIGDHFAEVSDSLLNTLQLNRLSNTEGMNNAILEASIEQRSKKLSPIPFHSAVNFSINKKYLKFTLPPLVLLLFLILYSPKVITEPSKRIINYNTKFEEKAPFSFIIENENLEVIENSDFELRVRISGDIVPNEVYIVVDGYPFKTTRINAVSFEYKFNKVRNTKHFHFQSGKYAFNEHELKVLPKPMIIDFKVHLDYPSYTNKKDETMENTGDFIIPEGTKIKWIFNTRDARELKLNWNNQVLDVNNEGDGLFNFDRKLLNSSKYNVYTINEHHISSDTLNFDIDVIEDAFPLIRIEEFKDSTQENMLYFRGFLKEDYGFRQLQFVYSIQSEDTDSAKNKRETIPINPQRLKQDFYYFINLEELNLSPGDALTYYFQVWDNDGVNGSKSSKSRTLIYRVATLDELEKAKENRSEELQDQMVETQKKAAKMNKEMDRLSKKLAEKKNLDWQDKETLKNLLEQYNSLLKELTEIQKQNEINQRKDQVFNKEDERILEKQKQLNELFDKLLTPEMKKMMQEMQKMMEEEMKKEDAQDMLDKMKLENEDIEKQLDRDLEIFKQMEFDMKLQDAIDQLKELQKKQEELGKKSELGKENNDKIKKEQEELNKEFEKFEKSIEEAKKANEKLENPNKMEDTKTEQNEIKDQQQQSKDQLSKGKNKSASKMQQKASESMKKLSEKLEQMQSNMEMESTGEDMETLREILANLLESSFNQEALMQELKSTSNSDPKYPKLIHRQKQIREDMQMIEDSLLALSKRQASIAPIVNKEVGKINSGIDQTLSAMLDLNTIDPTVIRKKDQAVAKQQYTMTSMNNLALMLSEALDQMQQQSMQQKSGKGSCKKPKPGQSGSSMKSIRQMQQALNKKMKAMQQQMKNGKSKGNGKGKGSQSQGEKMSEEMARMAAQQEAIRKKLQGYQEQLKKEGRLKEAQGLNGTAKKMEENETDLVNKILRAESFHRQQEIETRLLEAENAERKRGEEEKRESKEGKKMEDNPNIEFFDYIRRQNKEVELLKTIPPELKPFYKNKVNEYFEDIDKD